MALSVGQSSKAFSMVSADQGVVRVAVGTVGGASDEHVAEQGPPGDDKVQLVPVLGSGVSPGHSVLRFGGEEGVGDAQIMESAEFKQPLSVLLKLAYSEVSYASRP